MIRPRTLARRLALQYCFMADINNNWEPEPLEGFLDEHCENPEARDFAVSLVEGVRGNIEAIDAKISENAKNWDLRRIAAVERNVMRLACNEFLEGATPVKVIINEAVSLAKNFGSRDSGKFVNGILDAIAKDMAKTKV